MNLHIRTCLVQTWTIPGALGSCKLGRLWRHRNQQAEKTEVGGEDNSNGHINMWLSEVLRHFVQEQWCYPLKPEHIPSWGTRFCLQIPPPHHCSWTSHRVCVLWQGCWSLAHCESSLVAVPAEVSHLSAHMASGLRAPVVSSARSPANPAHCSAVLSQQSRDPCSGRTCHFNSLFLART